MSKIIEGIGAGNLTSLIIRRSPTWGVADTVLDRMLCVIPCEILRDNVVNLWRNFGNYLYGFFLHVVSYNRRAGKAEYSPRFYFGLPDPLY